MVRLLLGTFAGLGAHQLNTIIESWEANGTPRNWTQLARYAIGVMTILPIFVLIKYNRKHETETDDIGAYLMAACSVGCGVAAGYLLDSVKSDNL